MTTGIKSFLSPQELSHLSRLVLQSRYVVEGNLAGRHRSPNRGSSTEFADHRAYATGDDPKRLDWKVFGKTDRYYVRRYEDETNLRVYLIVDRSASMGYASAGVTKFRYACHLGVALGYSVVKARDSVGLYFFSDKIDATLGARNSFQHLNNIAKLMEQQQPSSTTATARTLHQIADSVRRRGLIVLLSDLLDEPDEVIRALAHFRKQHHDVIVFHTLDPAELDFPFKKGTEFVDMETGERVMVDPRALAPEYRKAFARFLEAYRKPCREMNIDYRLINTKEPMDTFVRAYLEERKRFSK